MKQLGPKKSKKSERERQVLLGLVAFYLETGKPVGSQALGEFFFPNLSSATLRNYFIHLEEQGYLKQQHASGGRIPTDRAFRLYADAFQGETSVERRDEAILKKLAGQEMREMALYLQGAAEELSALTDSPVFVSAPRFDNDFVIDMKLLAVDARRCLCILVTDFGLIKTLTFHVAQKMTAFTLKRIEAYFHWQLTGQDQPELMEEELTLARQWYHEAMVRYLVEYSKFTHNDVYTTGFSRLLAYPEFDSPAALANGLALFESPEELQHLLLETAKRGELSSWIGSELTALCPTATECTVLAIPYKIHQATVGAVGLLGPMRLPYRRLFGVLRLFAEAVTETLTRSLYKYRIGFRHPQKAPQGLLAHQAESILLENKGASHDIRK